jgi:hypothetical protein
MKQIFKFIIAIAVIAPLTFMSCNILRQDDAPESGKGRVKIHITDAPFPADLVEHVFVTIDRVGLRNSKGTCVDTEDPEFECAEGFLLMLDEPVTVDLMLLRNGLTDLLVDESIPVGKYDMLRLYVTDARIVVEEGHEYALKVPGGSESGLKVFLSSPVVISEEGIAEILVDFDLSRSFVALGNPKNKHGISGFIFKPVIRAVDLNKSGTIKGKVTAMDNAPLVNAGVALYAGEELVATAVTGEDGEYEIPGVPQGTYRLVVEMAGYVTGEVSGIKVEKKKTVLKTIRLNRE